MTIKSLRDLFHGNRTRNETHSQSQRTRESFESSDIYSSQETHSHSQRARESFASSSGIYSSQEIHWQSQSGIGESFTSSDDIPSSQEAIKDHVPVHSKRERPKFRRPPWNFSYVHHLIREQKGDQSLTKVGTEEPSSFDDIPTTHEAIKDHVPVHSETKRPKFRRPRWKLFFRKNGHPYDADESPSSGHGSFEAVHHLVREQKGEQSLTKVGTEEPSSFDDIPTTHDSAGSWEWRRKSQQHRDKFEKLHEFGKKSPETITEINDVRVCFKKECLIKRGSDGTRVYVGLSKDGGERAVKRLVRDDDICSSLAEQEKEILNERNAIKSNHVVKYRFLDKSNDDWLYLIMDLCEETLEDFVQRSSSDELLKIGQNIIQQILRGLADIHHDPRSILHRDLKPSNILRDVDDNWLLADFGISRILTPEKSTCLTKQEGTDHWRAVESCLNYASDTVEVEVRYKKESDVQVAGMVAFYVLTKGKHPFGKVPDQLRNVLDGKPVYLNKVKDSAANDLISWMLSHEPKARPLAEEALKHPYLASPEHQFKMLCEVANQREIKKGDVDTDVVQKLKAIPGDWQKQIDSKVLNYLRVDFVTGKPHKYGPSWCECLRLIRNVNQHWYDISRQRPQPDEEFYLVDNPQKYFLNVFPNLPTDVHRIVRSSDWKERPNIKEYFQ